METFRGQSVWVTGANGGMGRAVADRFAALGATVTAFDLRFDGAARDYRTVVLDISDPEAVAAARGEAGDDVDILVNVAGVLTVAALDDLTQDDWQRSLAVNATGAFNMIRAVSPLFKARRRGCIVTVSSNAAHLPRKGMAAYGASKAALTSLTMTAGLELAAWGVRCNVVSPGSTDTPMLRAMAGGDDLSGFVQGAPDQFKLGIPLGKVATPDDIAGTVTFLASPAAGHITLADILVDGGATLGK